MERQWSRLLSNRVCAQCAHGSPPSSILPPSSLLRLTSQTTHRQSGGWHRRSSSTIATSLCAFRTDAHPSRSSQQHNNQASPAFMLLFLPILRLSSSITDGSVWESRWCCLQVEDQSYYYYYYNYCVLFRCMKRSDIQQGAHEADVNTSGLKCGWELGGRGGWAWGAVETKQNPVAGEKMVKNMKEIFWRLCGWRCCCCQGGRGNHKMFQALRNKGNGFWDNKGICKHVNTWGGLAGSLRYSIVFKHHILKEICFLCVYITKNVFKWCSVMLQYKVLIVAVFFSREDPLCRIGKIPWMMLLVSVPASHYWQSKWLLTGDIMQWWCSLFRGRWAYRKWWKGCAAQRRTKCEHFQTAMKSCTETNGAFR